MFNRVFCFIFMLLETNFNFGIGNLILLCYLLLCYLVRNHRSRYQFIPPLNLGLKQILLLSVDEVSHSHLNADEVLRERIITILSLHLNDVGVRMHNYHSLVPLHET